MKPFTGARTQRETRNVSATPVTPIKTRFTTQRGRWKLCFLSPSKEYGNTKAIVAAIKILELTVNMQNVLNPI